uniref:Cytochrome n=1 Tax=Macrostomum lignano TaxID=282301 RepID=A0A1I8FFX8_9PLAT
QGSDALLQARAGTYLSVSYSRNLSGVRSGRASMDSLLLLLPAQRQRHLVAAAALARRLRRCLPAAPPPPAPTPGRRPGPRPWPLFGNLFNLERPTFLVAHSKWRRQYGDLVSFTFGSPGGPDKPGVAEVFSGRINSPFILSMTHGKGIVSAEGELWREHRRFALKVLRDFGFARSGTEEAIHAELAELQQTLDASRTEAETDELRAALQLPGRHAGRGLHGLHAGLPGESARPTTLAASSRRPFRAAVQHPGFMRLLQLIGVDVFVFKRNIEVTHRFCRDQIDRHRRNLAEVSEPADFLDAFLLEQQRLNSKRSCQDRIAAEVEAATGNSRPPARLPGTEGHCTFTIGFIDEACKRYSTLAPSRRPRCTPHQVQAEQFRPERFINSSGEYETSEFLVPFSIGKRACLGESLARQELFLFLSGIFQAYGWSWHKDCYKDLKDIEVGSAGLGARTWQAPDHLPQAGSEVIRWSCGPSLNFEL